LTPISANERKSVALWLSLLTTFCWGSWTFAIPALHGRIALELFWLDFAMGSMVTATIAWAIFGRKFFVHDSAVHIERILLAIGAGGVHGFSIMLIGKGINLQGIDISMLLCTGAAMLLATTLTYFTEVYKNEQVLLFVGALLGLMATCTLTIAKHVRQKAGQEAEPRSPSEAARWATDVAGFNIGRKGGCMKLFTLFLAFLFSSFWCPIMSLARRSFGEGLSDEGLSPYGGFWLFCLGVAFVLVANAPLAASCPLEGGSGVPWMQRLEEYVHAPIGVHFIGMAASVCWSIGMISFNVGGSMSSFASVFAIGECAPLVGIVWGVLHFKDFLATSCALKYFLALTVGLYTCSIVFIARSRKFST